MPLVSRPLCAAFALLALMFSALDAPSAACAQRGATPGGGRRDSAARSADVEARRLFDIAAQAFAGGRYEEALDHFEAAYSLSPRPELLYNIGLAQDRLRRDRPAIASFERFLAEVPTTPKRVEVEGRLAALRQATRRQDEADARTALERDRLALEARDADLRARDAEGSSVFASPWFWVVVGVVVVGAGTATAVALTAGDPGVQQPIAGTDGVVIMALDGI